MSSLHEITLSGGTGKLILCSLAVFLDFDFMCLSVSFVILYINISAVNAHSHCRTLCPMGINCDDVMSLLLI